MRGEADGKSEVDQAYSKDMERHVREGTDDIDVEDNLGLCHSCDAESSAGS